MGDKATGQSREIQITTEDRTPKSKIDEMIRNAEKYAKEDEAQRERVAARNELEAYAFQVKSALVDSSAAGKIEDSEKVAAVEKCEEVLSWIEASQGSDGAEYKQKQRELEGSVKEVMMKLHGQSGAQAQNADQESGNTAGQGPTIEEMD